MRDLIQSLNTASLETCFAGLQREDTALALATVIQAISPTSGKPGDKALVSSETVVEGWIGGGCAQPAVIEAARTAIDSGESSVIRVGPKGEWQPLDGVVDFASGCLSGGTLVIFIEPMIRKPRLAILGNSPVAHSLSYQAEHLGFAVSVADPDLDPAMFSESVRLAQDFSNPSCDFLVIATQGKHDRAALKAALASNAVHIAMIASAKKIAGLKASLKKAGVESAQLERIHSPAGIEINAVTPAEIALSVMAELVRVRRGNQDKNNVPEVPQQSVVTESSAEGSGGCCHG